MIYSSTEGNIVNTAAALRGRCATFLFGEDKTSPLTVGRPRTREIEDAANESTKEVTLRRIDGWQLHTLYNQILAIRGNDWDILVYKTTRLERKIVCEIKLLRQTFDEEQLREIASVWEKFTEKLAGLSWLTRINQ